MTNEAVTSARTVRVLAENGCEVVLPKALRCCGAPHAGEGDFTTLRDLARHNVDLFSRFELDYIVADCAACSAQTKEYGHLLRDDSTYRDAAAAFSAKVRDVTELLAEIPASSNASGAPMTYQLDGWRRPYERARALITAVTTTIKAKPASIRRLLSTASSRRSMAGLSRLWRRAMPR